MEECLSHAEGVFTFDPADHDVEATLTRLGLAYVDFVCSPEKASALRTVIAIADRMPEIGRVFYETGPAVGIAKLAAYLRTQTEAGVLAIDDLRRRGVAVHGMLQVDIVLAGAVQFPAGAAAGGGPSCRRPCRAQFHASLSRALAVIAATFL